MRKWQLDRSTVFGILLAILGTGGGLMLDGGSVKQIIQPSAALIVIIGTLGALSIQFPLEVLAGTARMIHLVILEAGPYPADVTKELVSYCTQARRHGIVRLEAQLPEISDPFLRKALTFAVDGATTKVMEHNMEVELDLIDEREYSAVQVLEAAGGFAPTLGIIGAVLGLIQVMQRMENVAEIGKGIAVAFVSTLYGLGFANLVLLPLGGKLRIRLRRRQLMREMMLDAVIAIMDGIGPLALKEKLDCYTKMQIKSSSNVPKPELVSQ